MDDIHFETLLRQQLQTGDAPPDNGFSLRVMAALPTQIPARRRLTARWVRRGQWAATGLAASSLALLATRQAPTHDLPHTLAALALLALLVFWAVPSRWSRG